MDVTVAARDRRSDRQAPSESHVRINATSPASCLQTNRQDAIQEIFLLNNPLARGFVRSTAEGSTSTHGHPGAVHVVIEAGRTVVSFTRGREPHASLHVT